MINIKADLTNQANDILATNTSGSIKLIKPLLNFTVSSNKEIVNIGEEFIYTLTYEMLNANQENAKIEINIPDNLELISYENSNDKIVEQKFVDGKLIYTLNTKDIEKIDGTLNFKVKFKDGVEDATSVSLEAKVKYPTEYIAKSSPVILNNFSVAEISIISTENKVAKDEEFTYIVNFTSQGGKDPLKVVLKLSDTIEILAANNLSGITPIIDKEKGTVTYEIPVGDKPISSQFEIRVKFKGSSQNGAIGNVVANIIKDEIPVKESVSSDTILEIKPKLEIIKNLLTSTSLSPNSIAKYRVTVKNSEKINLNGFKIKDILPKEALFVEAVLKDSKLSDIPDTLIENKNGEVIATVPVDYTESNLYLEITVEYKELNIGSKITNNVEVYDNTDNYVNRASVTNLVQEKNGEGVLSKLATNRVNSAGGSQGWNLYIKNHGNVSFDRFILKDKIPYEHNVYIINSGKYEGYNTSTTMSINIKTNKRDKFNVANLTGDELSVGVQVNLNKVLSSGEYMTDYEVIIENVPVGFTYSGWSCMRLDGNVRAKHIDGTFIEHNEIITNTATLDYISKEVTGIAKDSDSFIFKSAYTAYVEKKVLSRSTGINTMAEYELITTSPKRNLPKPIVFDIIPDGMEYINYEISIKDNAGNIINSPLSTNVRFEKVRENDKDIVRWIFDDNLPQNQTISIKLRLRQIKNKTFINNEMGVSTQNINGEIRGVYGLQSNEMETPIDKLQPDSLETLGYDYDGNGNKGGDLHAKANVQYNVGNKAGITVEKYIKNQNDTNYSTNIESKKGNVVNYKLYIKNVADEDVLTNLSVVDILPAVGDKNLLVDTERGSLFTLRLIDKFTVLYNGKELAKSEYKVNYSSSSNPERVTINGTIGDGVWSESIINSDDVKSIKFEFSDIKLQPQDVIEIRFDMEIPNNVDEGIYAINSFQASFTDIRGDLLYPVESNKVIVKTPKTPPTPPIELKKVELTKVDADNNEIKLDKKSRTNKGRCR